MSNDIQRARSCGTCSNQFYGYREGCPKCKSDIPAAVAGMMDIPDHRDQTADIEVQVTE